ncbi:uncharacterized protein B4U79_08315 [Dinothrombium tinctorium]|uniref:F-box domain-containing protein n=1 Tax=Dinothrombium tinctorium TaxID=1965070 RepID=A0A3S3S233_9ACAR|nr:uncharacterized protein B4U79_05802 [Dinothrombium tinctorium]RWS09404.1 uncharacterized protein B4U79_08315 [Dinothrombium tinctorium]
MWEYLPDVLLEQVFQLLTMKERHIASQVCSNWFRIFNSHRVWSTIVCEDHTLSRRKYNYYLGYQLQLDHYRMHMYLSKFGRCIREIIITPMTNLFNLYEFMKMLTYFAEFFDENPLHSVHTFDFTFACHVVSDENKQQEYVFGTGGRMLLGLKNLLRCLSGLEKLSLRELLLEKNDAQYLLDDVLYNCCETMRLLRIINCTKLPFPIFHVSCFVNLQTLIITPQHLNDEVINQISCNTKLANLWIIQTKYTEQCLPVSSKTWKECTKNSPDLNVHLVVTGKFKSEVIWQSNAPVKSIVYDTPYAAIKAESILMAISLYGPHLEVYSFHGLPRYTSSKSFVNRGDVSLALLCRMCPRLRKLVIRERVSTATLLLIAITATSLRELIVRRNAIIKRFDWKREDDWSDSFYNWLKRSSTSYENTFAEISKIFGREWKPLSDECFKRIRPDVAF